MVKLGLVRNLSSLLEPCVYAIAHSPSSLGMVSITPALSIAAATAWPRDAGSVFFRFFALRLASLS